MHSAVQHSPEAMKRVNSDKLVADVYLCSRSDVGNRNGAALKSRHRSATCECVCVCVCVRECECHERLKGVAMATECGFSGDRGCRCAMRRVAFCQR